MACVPQTSHPEKIEHLPDQNGCHRKDGLEVTNAKVVGFENDDWEKDSAHDGPNDIHFPPQRCLSTADRVQDTEYDNAICHLEDHMEVNLSSIQQNSNVDNVGQVSFRKRRKQNSRRMLEEMLALSEQGELLEDDEGDDRDWEPFEQFAVLTKWFCTNCTMANFGDSVYCDLCGEHQNSDLIPAGIPSKCEVPGERLEETKKSAVTFSFPTPPMLEESFTQASHRRTAVGFDERMLLHSEIEMKSHPHPERPDRLRAIAASLAAAGLFPGKCFPISAREITCQELAMVHTLEHVNAVELTSCKISSYFTADTYANQHSALAAKLAAGLCADLATTIMTGQAQNGFALVRPPGHHAGVKDSMGFCLHNNAAIAVSASRAAGAKKVLILDWDVHHGNGTQEIFYSDNSVLYISLHRHEGGHFYPGSGAASEVGSFGGEGYSVNIPWKRGGVGDNDYIFAFQHVVIPIAEQFAPDLTIISAGFDAAKGDPLGCCEVTPAGFANMTQMLIGPAKGKLLIILEGGYNLRSISASATAVLKVLVGDNPEPLPPEIRPSKAGFKTVLEVLEIQSKYWASVKGHYLKLHSQRKTLYTRKKRKIKMKKFIVGGPIWWKWGRKRVVYDHWFARVHLRNHSR